ncbi:tetratricopeptide repeat protein [Parvularcula lutaonensis]|uniref:Tetratricopeptide repeat protein n=1 Tax=Parvularcula lutaonensis TaxID=491923 RepID=A0ABV7M800_9PROT|nr:tetratricopeptide repeat protein [Parvularcula lutaonensis]GGY41469.1 hypothetical protein GCM10007148_07580 [Parvularcula lutaonensis]
MGFSRCLAPLALVLVLAGCSTFGSGRQISSESDEASVSGAYLQGRFAAQAFDIPTAGDAFEEVARRTEGPEGSRTAFGYALASGDIDEAERQARLVIAQRLAAEGDETGEPGIQADMPRLTLAAAAMRDGDSQRAADLLSRPMRSSLGQSLSVLLRSAAIYDAEGIEAATKILAEQEPGSFRGLVPLHAAFLFELEGDAQSAEAAYRQAISAPRGEIAALGFARLLERDGRSEEAATIYTRMIQDSGLYSRAGRMGLVRLGKLENEGRSFARTADRQPPLARNAKAVFSHALSGFAWLGFEQAVSVQASNQQAEQVRRSAMVIPLGLANLARTVDPQNDTANYLAALIFGYYQTPEESIKASSAIRPASWLYTYAVLETATAQFDSGDTEAALRTLKSALATDGAPVPQWALQAHIYLASEERYEEADKYGTMAIEAAERWGVLPSSLWRYYFARGAARHEGGNWPGARADLEKALELAPDEPVILNHLGYTYVERGEDLDRAFGMIERALAIDPQNGAIVDSLGWAHFQRGNYAEAVRYLEEAVSLEPGDAVITDHLGDAYYMVGRDRDARYEWQRVLTLDDADDELRAEVRAKLDKDFRTFATLAGREDRS